MYSTDEPCPIMLSMCLTAQNVRVSEQINAAFC